MTPYHPMFRRLLHRNIPQLDNKDIDRYGSLIALRHNLFQESRIILDPKGILTGEIDQATRQAQAIFMPYAKVFDACLRLWVARRQLLLRQGNFLQIPLNLGDLARLVSAIWNYRAVQIATFPRLAANRFKYYWKNLSLGRVLIVVISGLLIAISLFGWISERKQRPDAAGVQQQ